MFTIYDEIGFTDLKAYQTLKKELTMTKNDHLLSDLRNLIQTDKNSLAMILQTLLDESESAKAPPKTAVAPRHIIKLPHPGDISYHFFYTNNKPHLTVAVANTPKEGYLVGMALCSKHDIPSLDEGRAIALGRIQSYAFDRMMGISFIASEGFGWFKGPSEIEKLSAGLSLLNEDSHTFGSSTKEYNDLYDHYKEIFKNPQKLLK